LTFLAPFLLGDFNHPDNCWRNNTAGHKQYRRFPENIDDKFLTTETVEQTERGALLDLILTNKEEFIRDVNTKGRLGCSDYEMTELRILRGMIP